MERLKYDHHLAQDLVREASDLIGVAMDKLHAAEALFQMDDDRPESSARRAEWTRSAYAHAGKARNEAFYADIGRTLDE